jgi:hypothetical protein
MRFARWLLWSTLIISCASTAREPALSADYETVFAGLAMGCIHQEYSNKIAHYMNDEGDLKPPRELYPAFYGCFDWHSSVHGHWLLVRLLNTTANLADRNVIEEKLNQSFSAENIVGELANYQRPGMKSFERPYGIAWLLQLTAELRQSPSPKAKTWLNNLLPLERQAVVNISEWLPN